ncbi:MAG TPA: methyltransferase domain-containing protein [bacterium]|nr:methyltransferase domain-containing protein [bacterium]
MKILDLGCGPHKTPGAFGVDAYSFAGVDLVHDLNRLPWPLANNEYERIVARHIIEHVEDVPAFMAEIHRVAAPGARVEIVTPHFSNRSAYADPTHKRAMSVRAFDFFTGGEPRELTTASIATHWLFEHRFVFERFAHVPPFSRLERRLTFSRIFRYLGVTWLANRFLDFYEFYCAWIYPARDIEVVLRVEKE